MKLTEQQKIWILSREAKFKYPNSGWSSEELHEVFRLQGHIEDRVVKPTSCNRCIKTAIQTVWKAYLSELSTS